MRYIAAGEITGNWGDLVGVGATLTNLAHLKGPPATQNMETVFRSEKERRVAWELLARDRGSLGIIKDELIEPHSEGLYQRPTKQDSPSFSLQFFPLPNWGPVDQP